MVEKITCCGFEIWFPYMKAHYFLLNAALCAVLPYVHVYAIKFGFSAMTVGTIFMLLPFGSMIFKPLFGFLSDYTKKMKVIYYFMLGLFSLSCVFFAFIPAPDFSADAGIYCDNLETSFKYSNQSNLHCITKIQPERSYYCFAKCMDCSDKCFYDAKVMSFDLSIEYNRSMPLGVFNILNLEETPLGQLSTNGFCTNYTYFSCNVTCDSAVHDCYKQHHTQNTELGTTQFILYCMLLLFINLSMSTLVTLGDTACFNVLGNRIHLYGRQRLFGTIGWGLSSPLWGLINNWLSGKLPVQTFYGSFIIVAVLAVMNGVVLFPIEMNSSERPRGFRKDLGKILRRVEICMFLVSVFMGGTMIGVLWTFMYWHLTSLGGTLLLLGLVPAIECIIGEIPFFVFASSIIHRLGPFNSITVCLLAGGLRFLLMSYLIDPWWVLPLGILQGPMFGLFFATMAMYAKIAAPPGTEATMQGILGGTFEGLGVGTGSLVGGIFMEKYGGSKMFFGAGIVAFVFATINIIVTILLTISRRRGHSRNRKEDVVNKGDVTIACLNNAKEDEGDEVL